MTFNDIEQSIACGGQGVAMLRAFGNNQMKLKRFEPFKNNKPLRYSLAALVAVALFSVIYGDRTGWWRKTLGEIKAETAIECPQLEKGCTFRIKDAVHRKKRYATRSRQTVHPRG